MAGGGRGRGGAPSLRNHRVRLGRRKALPVCACRLAVVRRHARAGDWRYPSRQSGYGRSLHVRGAHRADDRSRVGRRRIAPAVTRGRPCRRLGGLFVVAVLGVASRKQLGYWRDSTALFTHALAVTTDNWLAHNNLGYVLLRQGRTEEATAHFRAALAIKPGYMDAVNNLGDVLIRSDRAEDAIAHFSAALALHPDDPVTHYNLGNALAKRGDVDAAAREFAAAVR